MNVSPDFLFAYQTRFTRIILLIWRKLRNEELKFWRLCCPRRCEDWNHYKNQRSREIVSATISYIKKRLWRREGSRIRYHGWYDSSVQSYARSIAVKDWVCWTRYHQTNSRTWFVMDFERQGNDLVAVKVVLMSLFDSPVVFSWLCVCRVCVYVFVPVC